MNRRLALAFLVIVLVPLSLLGWLGVRLAREQEEIVRHRYRELLLGKLEEIDTSLARTVRSFEVELLRETQFDSYDAALLRQYVRHAPRIRQLFVLDPEGRPIHPPPEGDQSAAEREFLDRTREIWVGKLIPNVQAAAPAAPAIGSGTQAQDAPADHGWYTWYWADGINLIFWRRDDSGYTVGVEVDRPRLVADMVGQLPITDPADPLLPDGRIALADWRDRTVYQWGLYDPAAAETPRASLTLSYPLNAWGLHYFGPAELFEAGRKGVTLFQVVSGLTVVGIALLALAAYFYRQTTRELREAAQRVTFVNQVSHELKTPLTSIRMYAELLDREVDEGDEATRRHLGIIVSESQRLSRLIGNILTFARSRRGRLRLHPGPGVVDDLIGTVLERFRPAMEGKGVRTGFDGNAKGDVLFDGDAVEQILGNLFSNVEKYAASGGVMEVASRQADGRTVISVSDRGPGVPEKERDRIFKPFYRLSDRLSDGVTGTGIGLSISRELARLHGGDLVLDPRPAGACFRVTLETPAAPMPDDTKREEEPNEGSDRRG